VERHQWSEDGVLQALQFKDDPCFLNPLPAAAAAAAANANAANAYATAAAGALSKVYNWCVQRPAHTCTDEANFA
jgi:uncharacterized protein (UPF0333 family)